jgi:hypothetical protein
MRSTGDYATIGGHEYRVVARGNDADGSAYVGLLLDGPNASGFDRVIERSSGDRMAKVRRGDLDSLVRVTTTGIVDGAEVTVYGTDGDVVPCSFVGDPAWAEQHGFSGSQHDGWTGEVRRHEIEKIRETVADLLHPADAGGGR